MFINYCTGTTTPRIFDIPAEIEIKYKVADRYFKYYLYYSGGYSLDYSRDSLCFIDDGVIFISIVSNRE